MVREEKMSSGEGPGAQMGWEQFNRRREATETRTRCCVSQLPLLWNSWVSSPARSCNVHKQVLGFVPSPFHSVLLTSCISQGSPEKPSQQDTSGCGDLLQGIGPHEYGH